VGALEGEVSVLLETRRLLKQFGEFRAVDHVDFRVQDGEVLALIGSNGAGKTTLVNLISGLLRADAGQIIFRGQDVTQQTVHQRIAAGIARSFQLVNLFDQLSALDNVALAIFSRQGKTRKLLALAEADRPVWQEAMDILHLFRMESKARILAGGLSQGERKLLDVAIAYALRRPAAWARARKRRSWTRSRPWCDRSTSRRPSSSTTWTSSSRTPTASSPCTRGRSSPTAPPTRSAGTSAC
jgi:ABC-type branched-subunit amino acid transport system ATPase component